MRPKAASVVAPTQAPAASPAPAKGKGAVVGVGIGVLVLGALRFGGWRMMAAPSPGPAPTPAPATTPAPVVAVAPAPALATSTTPAPVPAPLPAPAPAAPTKFEPEREFDRIVQAQTSGFAVRAEAVKTELSIARKDEFKFRVTAERDGFVYVVGQSPDGALALLVPNASTPTVRVRKGQTWSFPPTRDGFYIPAVDPPGVSRVIVLVSANKRSFDAMQPKPEGPIKLFATGDQANAIAAQFKGSNSPLAGQAVCPGAVDCTDDYGAALMKFETRP